MIHSTNAHRQVPQTKRLQGPFLKFFVKPHTLAPFLGDLVRNFRILPAVALTFDLHFRLFGPD